MTEKNALQKLRITETKIDSRLISMENNRPKGLNLEYTIRHKRWKAVLVNLGINGF